MLNSEVQWMTLAHNTVFQCKLFSFSLHQPYYYSVRHFSLECTALLNFKVNLLIKQFITYCNVFQLKKKKSSTILKFRWVFCYCQALFL